MWRSEAYIYIYIPPGQMPQAISIRIGRLNPYVPEAENYDRSLKIIGSQTLRRLAARRGANYGQPWTKE